MLNCKVNFFNGTSIREYWSRVIPIKNLRFKIIGSKIEVKSGGYEGCSSFDAEYAVDIKVHYRKSDNSFTYKYDSWCTGDEDTWGHWNTRTVSLDYSEIIKGVFYIEGEEPPMEMILNFFKSCRNGTTIVTVQPYWSQRGVYIKADHSYDYFISDLAVPVGTIVKLPRNSFGVVLDCPRRRISKVANAAGGYNYTYKEAIVVNDPAEIEKYHNIIKQVKNNNKYFEAEKQLKEFINIIFKDVEHTDNYIVAPNFVVELDDKNYFAYTVYPVDFTVNLFKHLNLAFNNNSLVYKNTMIISNYLKAKPLDNVLTKLEFFEAFEEFLRSTTCLGNIRFKIYSEPIAIHIIN